MNPEIVEIQSWRYKTIVVKKRQQQTTISNICILPPVCSIYPLFFCFSSNNVNIEKQNVSLLFVNCITARDTRYK